MFPVISLGILLSIAFLNLTEPAPTANATVVTGVSAYPDAHRERCTGKDVDFSLALLNVGFDPSTGVITYTPEIKYERCNSKQTRSYAVYGNGYCSLLGYYGGGANGTAYDCAKYIGNPKYSGSSGITCPGGTDAQCWFNSESYALGTGAAVAQNQPGYSPTTFLNPGGVLSYQIDNWNSRQHRDGSFTLTNGVDGFQQICQYYKAEPSLTAADAVTDRCISPSITVTWAAEWSVSPAVSMSVNGTGRGNDYTNPHVVRPGDVTDWSHSMRNNGPNRTNQNVAWSVFKDMTNGTPGSGGQSTIHNATLPSDSYAGTSLSYANSYTAQASDAGRRVCEANIVAPRAYNNGSFDGTSWLCVRVKYYRITPTIDPSNDTFIGEPSDAGGRITHTGSLEDNHEIKLVAYRYDSTNVKSSGALGARASSGETPCNIGALRAISGFDECRESNPAIGNYNGGNPMSINRSFSSFGFSGPYALGTTFCYVLSVKDPTESAGDDNNWYHSAASCTTSAKKPRVQFLGADLRVNGTAYSVPSDIGGTTYGSWVEYGAFSSDVNNFVGSGNGLRDGDAGSQSDWSELTFANKDNPAMTPYGFYDPLPAPTSAYGYFTDLARTATLSDTNIPNGVYDIGGTIGTGLARLGETRGGSVILRSSGTLTIDRNIEVNNDGLTNANQITQVVIVADNININPNVTRIDAWLVTENGGFVNTCTGSGQLTADGPCKEQLVVNGAVYTDNLKLRRTAGSDPETTDDLKRGAEVFNLRPDSVLWSYFYASKGDFPKTDFVQELPPRY